LFPSSFEVVLGLLVIGSHVFVTPMCLGLKARTITGNDPLNSTLVPPTSNPTPLSTRSLRR